MPGNRPIHKIVGQDSQNVTREDTWGGAQAQFPTLLAVLDIMGSCLVLELSWLLLVMGPLWLFRHLLIFGRTVPATFSSRSIVVQAEHSLHCIGRLLACLTSYHFWHSGLMLRRVFKPYVPSLRAGDSPCWSLAHRSEDFSELSRGAWTSDRTWNCHHLPKQL